MLYYYYYYYNYLVWKYVLAKWVTCINRLYIILKSVKRPYAPKDIFCYDIKTVSYLQIIQKTPQRCADIYE